MLPKPLFYLNYILATDIKILIFLSLIISISLTISSHPIIMISLISTQALVVCLVLWLIIPSTWFSFILFLVFMGGLIVLFVYVSRLASNEKISLTNPWKASKIITPLVIIRLFGVYTFNLQNLKDPSVNSTLRIIFKVYSPNIIFITSLTIIYLLLTLIIIVKLITLKEGPIRNLQ